MTTEQIKKFDLEKVYDEEIHPLMAQIIEICKKHEMPMFATFEFANGSFCTTLLRQKHAHFVLHHYDALKQCIEGQDVNVDKYIGWLMKGAHKNGHSSIYLGQLGVPYEGEKKDGNS